MAAEQAAAGGSGAATSLPAAPAELKEAGSGADSAAAQREAPVGASPPCSAEPAGAVASGGAAASCLMAMLVMATLLHALFPQGAFTGQYLHFWL